ncbi:hypothetical protein EMIHUDRAFT_370577 [Emiliania huxleyi CCMP1516]|uniref:Glutathione S-transferase n=2 Tax=Emiliania huxleyi TaxID=2903 RepID=A0A0D3IWZ1_EMIH1|nr:hypothetical protein EMIHUDRAFT_370577 [Emiliania huxleyi CCMP1516]EOD15776.1 hypothetical protein EMIHUDRAFT_370577 [Emiliania huxleyi CCMP1516]|eukprot:XP_005768205.1 hypothetical protein EMIHUDRAFT_370577 [Emiliania huxleyi CCMP1516]
MLLKSVHRLARPSLLVAAGTFAGEAARRGFSQPASVCESAAAPQLTMIYFPVRALAEPARMILEFGGVAYEDASPQQAYGVPWKDAKDKTPFGQLPLLLVDGKELAQAGAIIRYCAALVPALVPAEPLEAARCDMIFEAARELDAVNPIVNAAFFDSFPAKLARLARQLRESEGPFSCGAAPRWCDFMLYHNLDNARLLEPAALDAYPEVRTFMAAVEATPRVAEFLQARPKPVDIGTKPMLEPNVPGIRVKK